MKVILSIDAVRFPLTGVGRYTFELAQHLSKSPQIDQLRFFSRHHIIDHLPSAQTHKFGTSAPPLLRQKLLKNPVAVDLYRMASQALNGYVLRKQSEFIFHGPNFYLPPFGGRSVCTFHDLSVFTWAHCHPPERVRYMRKEVALTLKRADMLITDSEYTRQEVASYFSWPLEKIRSIPLACSTEFRPRTPEELIPSLRKYGLELNSYSLYVGTIEPRKNLEALLNAYTLLPKSTRQQWPLILVGYQGWRSEELHQRIKQAEIEGWARYLGFVDEGDLPLIFAGARLFTFPSLYEGFGLPVLEAMASGTPVVCSNAATLPEVAGDAAAMCDPGDVDSLYQLISRGLEDENWRSSARENGLLRAKIFSWERCAQETASAYQKVSL